MDQNKFRNAEIISAAATVAASFLFHFLYVWTQSGFIALFSAVNESIWEHVKIVFFPYLIAAGIEYTALKPNLRRYLAAKATGLIFIPLAMISFYYTYSGILGFRLTAVDISCAVLWSVLAFLISYKLYFSKMSIEKNAVWLAALCAAFVLALFVFTYYPPHIPLFCDGVTGQFGIG